MNQDTVSGRGLRALRNLLRRQGVDAVVVLEDVVGDDFSEGERL